MVEVTLQSIEGYRLYLIEQERSKSTIEKYIRDVKKFYIFLSEDKMANKESVMHYKEYLNGKFKASSVNSMLVALNSYFDYFGFIQCKVRLLKVQRKPFSNERTELNKEEYKSLAMEAEKERNNRLSLIIETICATGIRVGEQEYITVDAVKRGKSISSQPASLIRQNVLSHAGGYCTFGRYPGA